MGLVTAKEVAKAINAENMGFRNLSLVINESIKYLRSINFTTETSTLKTSI
jgi:hypothetical protein